jgi:hypothetical protein
MAPSEQIEALRKMVSRGVTVWVIRAAVALAIGLAIAGLLTRHPIYFMLCAFATLLAFSTRQTAPHILNAVKALDCGVEKKGSVRITFTEWSDSRHYDATIQISDLDKWHFEFIPLGWQPHEGTHEATVFALQGVEWPALVQVEQGFIYPRYNPKRLSP